MNQNEIWQKNLVRILDVQGRDYKDLASLMQKSREYANGLTTGRKPIGKKKLEELLVLLDVDLSEFQKTDWIKSEGDSSSPGPVNVIEIEAEHNDVIKQFTDKELARDINKDLVKIERLSPSQFNRVAGYIKGVADTVDDVGRNNSEKRSGKDRRKTG